MNEGIYHDPNGRMHCIAGRRLRTELDIGKEKRVNTNLASITLRTSLKHVCSSIAHISETMAHRFRKTAASMDSIEPMSFNALSKGLTSVVLRVDKLSRLLLQRTCVARGCARDFQG